jgi:hypothetical protein
MNKATFTAEIKREAITLLPWCFRDRISIGSDQNDNS